MKNLLKYSLLMALMLSVLGCAGTDSKSENQESVSKTTPSESHNYSTDGSGLALKWIAYKFTEKLGVSGTFDKCNLELKKGTGTIEDLLTDAKLTITTTSVNSNNEIRDPKLRNSFFKVFNTDDINARILSVNQKTGRLELKMNGITKNVNYDYSFTNDTLSLSTHLDLLQWNGAEAMDSLNRVCYDLHKGSDGISKLWPDVDVSLTLPILKQ